MSRLERAAKARPLLWSANANLKFRQKLKEDIMKFRPLHDRVVVKRIDAEEKTAGGIIIPDTAKEKPSQGEVSPSARAAATITAS